MNQHEAVMKIAADAIRHIRDFATETIETIVSVVPDTTPNDVKPDDTSALKPAGRPRGRPRNEVVEKAVVEQAVQETVVESEPEPEVEAVVVDEAAITSSQYDENWFKDNLEEGRSLCRDLISERLRGLGGDVIAAKQEMMGITNRGAVKDFQGPECFIYYNAMTKILAERPPEEGGVF